MIEIIPNNNASFKLTIAGSIFVALALIVIFGGALGVSINALMAGMGDILLWFAGIAFVVLIIIAISKLIS